MQVDKKLQNYGISYLWKVWMISICDNVEAIGSLYLFLIFQITNIYMYLCYASTSLEITGEIT